MLQISPLWWKTDKNGEGYFSGQSTPDANIILRAGSRLLIFANTNKQQDNHPDYYLYVAAEQQQGAAPAPPPGPRPPARQPEGEEPRPTDKALAPARPQRPAPAPPEDDLLGDGLEDPFGEDEGARPARRGSAPAFAPRRR